MSGGWRYSDKKITVSHSHIQFEGFANGKKMFFAYVDPRRFGRIFYYNREHFDLYMTDRGVDISTKEFNLEYLKRIQKEKPKKILKPFLLDQHYFAGIGNYIASEICARAKLLPTRTMSSLSTKDLNNILKSTHSILHDTIKNGGTTFSGGYADATGDKGLGVQNLVVFYQKICGMCHTTKIIKIIQQGRGTYYCPRCQK
jgi:formamidopyrimidine-DNA glycosylase